MAYSSHRLRVEEKKLFRKFIYTLFSIVLIIFFIIYVGLPILAKIIVAFSSSSSEKLTTNISSPVLFPPVLNPVSEATNSSLLTISGIGEKETTVKIYLNDKEQAKVLTDNEGKFSFKKILLSEGKNTISVTTLKDVQESSPSASIIITYKKNQPTLEITDPKENQKFTEDQKEINITGITDPENYVTVNERQVIVDPQGKFNYRVILSSGENVFKIVASDEAGNQISVERKVQYNP